MGGKADRRSRFRRYLLHGVLTQRDVDRVDTNILVDYCKKGTETEKSHPDIRRRASASSTVPSSLKYT